MSDHQPNLIQTLTSRTDDCPALSHRTDRIALRNESDTPVVFVDDDPMFIRPSDATKRVRGPFATTRADIRHQNYGLDIANLDEIEAVIRDMIERFEGDTGQRFYYTVAGERAHIGGNGLTDYLDVIENFRTIYRDLDEQLNEPTEFQRPGFPHESMRVTCVALVHVEGTWLWFTTRLFDNPEERHYSSSTLGLTTLRQHGPLTGLWLQDRLDHPAVGRPSVVDRQSGWSKVSLPLTSRREPLTDVRSHALIGVGGDHSTEHGIEYISYRNPYYRPKGAGRSEQYRRLDNVGIPSRLASSIVDVDRLVVRPRGGSHGINEDVFIRAESTLTRFDASTPIVLASGKTTPIRAEKFERRETEPPTVGERAIQRGQEMVERLK